MNYAIFLDMLIIVLIIWGFTKGYKKGISLMLTPIISFITSMILFKPIGTIIYNIFGSSLNSLIQSILENKLGEEQNLISTFIANSISESGVIERGTEVVAFVLTYTIISFVCSSILYKLRLRKNNVVINTVDKNVGGLIGAFTEVCMICLFLAIIYIMLEFDFASDTLFTIKEMVNNSYLTKILFNYNPIILIAKV